MGNANHVNTVQLSRRSPWEYIPRKVVNRQRCWNAQNIGFEDVGYLTLFL